MDEGKRKKKKKEHQTGFQIASNANTITSNDDDECSK